MMVHISTGQIFSFLGMVSHRAPKIRNFVPKFWPFDSEYVENGKLKHYTLHVN